MAYDSKPREERHYKEIYPDLDAEMGLAVVVGEPEIAEIAEIREKPPKQPQSEHNAVYAKRSLVAAAAPRKLGEYGYRVSKAARKSVGPNIRALPSNRTRLQVQYDMDEQDEQYLRHHNQSSPLLAEAFELAITLLEQEWHKLEAQMGGMGAMGNDGLLTLEELFEKYGNDDGVGGLESQLEQRCAVCNVSECDNTNAIVFCDGCNIAVHQECYGIAFIPEGQWFCRRCMVGRGGVSCCFCPSKTGAFKQLDNGMWSHVTCALWIPEVYFANPIYMEPIEGIALVPKLRWKLVCYICRQRGGACVQCSNRGCFHAYHVTCARRAGLLMEMSRGVSGALALKGLLRSFCDKHTPGGLRGAVLEGIAKTRRFYRDSKLLLQKNDMLVSQRQHENRMSAFKWRTEGNTPIAPHKFVGLVAGLLRELRGAEGLLLLRGLEREPLAEDSMAAAAQLCRYWCLKREAKRGAPLVKAAPLRQVDSTQQVDEKIEFGRALVLNLARVRLLAELTRKRQLVAQEMVRLTTEAAVVVHWPVRAVLERHLAVLKRQDSRLWGLVERALEEYLCVQDVENRVLQVLALAQAPLRKAASRWLVHWRDVIVPELEAAENQTAVPFVEGSGLLMLLKQHNPTETLASEELSEVDEMTPEEARELRRLLKKWN